MADKLVVDCTTGEERPEALTAEEQAQQDADAVKAEQERQKTTAEETNRTSLRSKADQVITTLENATSTKATWDALTAAQRQEVTRLGLLAVAKIARLVLGRLDAS